MKFSWGLLVVVIFAISLNSCFDAPTYPTTPNIEYKNIQFIDVTTDPSAFDSLILTVKFKDGDGDLGLSPDEVGCYTVDGKKTCYNDKFYYQFSNGTFITYKTKRTNPNYDTLPAFVKPYNCINWEVTKVNDVVKDTLYFTLNQDHYNIFVDFLVKQSDGSFKEFDWRTEFNYPNCGIPFDGRFPVLAKDVTKKSPLEGEIRYAMTSVGFLVLFSTKTLKLRVSIQDRALNKSNVIETPEFRLK
jgi:hypothetical protein